MKVYIVIEKLIKDRPDYLSRSTTAYWIVGVYKEYESAMERVVKTNEYFKLTAYESPYAIIEKELEDWTI